MGHEAFDRLRTWGVRLHTDGQSFNNASNHWLLQASMDTACVITRDQTIVQCGATYGSCSIYGTCKTAQPAAITTTDDKPARTLHTVQV